MAPRQVILIGVFSVHWAVFAWLYYRKRRAGYLLPMVVFTLLVLTQVYWDSPVQLDLGGEEPVPLRTAFRHGAWTLAVPSLGLMLRRIHLRLSEARRTRASLDVSGD